MERANKVELGIASLEFAHLQLMKISSKADHAMTRNVPFCPCGPNGIAAVSLVDRV